MSRRGRRASGSSSVSRRSPACGGWLMSTGGGGGCEGIGSKYLRASSCTRGGDVAGDGDDGVVRRVVGLEERRDVLDRRGVEIVHRSDHRVLVGGIVERELVHRFVGAAVRLVVASLAALFLDGVALVVEVLLDDGERAHAVGFEEHRRLELIGRHRLVVERALLVRGAVHRAAVAEDGVEMLAGADVLRALEHHVLEEMREAGAAGALVARADVVDDGDREDRRDVILGDDHAQAVLQLRVGELDRGQRDGGQRGGRAARERQQGRPRAAGTESAVPSGNVGPDLERIANHPVARFAKRLTAIAARR